ASVLGITYSISICGLNRSAGGACAAAGETQKAAAAVAIEGSPAETSPVKIIASRPLVIWPKQETVEQIARRRISQFERKLSSKPMLPRGRLSSCWPALSFFWFD